MEFNPFYQKNSKIKKEYLKGELIIAGNGGFVFLPFKYGIDQQRAFQSQIAGGIAINYVAVTERIFTSQIDLPFAKNSKIKMNDGFIMTIENVDINVNENTGKTTAFYINLNGGGQ